MPEKDKLVPPVPAQEAPREPICKYCRHPIRPTCDPHNDHDYVHSESGYACCAKGTTLAEPQAGAQQAYLLTSTFDAGRQLGQQEATPPSNPRAGAQDDIPEDLQLWYSVTDYDAIKTLIERIGRAESALRLLREERNRVQVPSRDEYAYAISENRRLRSTISEMETHLNSIKSYATEAAKTPITREDMHDPLKAQTFFDEAKGFERFVLSEIGGGQ